MPLVVKTPRLLPSVEDDLNLLEISADGRIHKVWGVRAIRRVLVTGASGSLGAYVVDRLLDGNHEPIAWSRSEVGLRGGVAFHPLDLTGEGLESTLSETDPEIVLHLAALSAAEAVRLDPDRGRLVNVESTRRIADWCARNDRGLVFTSTDLVFDGSKSWSKEDDPAEPILAYGRTKRDAEPFVLGVPKGLVARVSLLYGFSRSGRDASFDRTIAGLRRGESQTMFEDEFRTPLDLDTAARALVGLAEVGATGRVHVAGRERVSRLDLIRRAAIELRLDPRLVRANRRGDVASLEPRPADVSLDTSRLATILPDFRRPTIEEALRRYFAANETSAGSSV